MTRKEFERWGQMRQGGRKSFIWMQGVLGFGLVMAVAMAVVLTVVNMFVENTAFDADFLVRQLIINLIFFPLVGYGWGAWTWSRTEKQYRQAKPEFSGTAMEP